jgi:uncharacterized protein (DUF983 family)
VPGQPDEAKGQPTLREAALFGLCPRCGARTLFDGPIKFAARCGACGLDFQAFNVGDGAAAFVTMAVGGVVMILVIALELAASPPWWVHVLLWIPVTSLGVIGALRVSKAALICSEFRQKAGEAGRR